jgi:hypothetical protein
MAAFVYMLCALTSIVCAALLLRNARQARNGLLVWSGWAFVCLALGNILLFMDMIILPDVSLLILRNIITLAALCLLLYGLIWETE